jgi:hypothetical protein
MPTYEIIIERKQVTTNKTTRDHRSYITITVLRAQGFRWRTRDLLPPFARNSQWIQASGS